MFLGFPCGSAGKESARNVGDLSLIPGLGRSPGEGKGYPTQYSGLENSMDCIVHQVTKSRTWLTFTYLFWGWFFNFLKKWFHFISTIGLLYMCVCVCVCVCVLNIYFIVLLQGSTQSEASLAPYLHPKRTFAKVWRHFSSSPLRVAC